MKPFLKKSILLITLTASASLNLYASSREKYQELVSSLRLSLFALDEKKYNEQYRKLVAQAASKRATQKSLDKLTPEQQARVAQMNKRIESRRRALMKDVDAILLEPQPFIYNPRLREIYPELPEYFAEKVDIGPYTRAVAATGIHYVQKQNPTGFGRVLQTYYSEKNRINRPPQTSASRLK